MALQCAFVGQPVDVVLFEDAREVTSPPCVNSPALCSLAYVGDFVRGEIQRSSNLREGDKPDRISLWV